MGVLDHDDRGVDHRADGDGDAAEAHDVGAQAQQVHAEIGDQHAERQRDDGDQRAADVQEEDDADKRDDRALLDQRPLEGIDRAVDQIGAVVDRFDGHALGEARRDLGEAVLDVADHGQRVLAKPLKRNAGNDFAFPVHFRDAATFVRRELDPRHVLEQHRHAAVALDDDLLQVGQALDVAAAAHRELGLRKLDGAPAHVHVAAAQRFADFGERNSERLQPPRVDHHAVLLDEAADAGDLGNALRLGDAVADVPVLDGPQLGEALLRPAHDVLIDPADAGRIGSETRRHAGRQPARSRAEVFEHARARPVEVGAVLEDHIDERDAEERETAHHAGFRDAQHGGGERIGDLILDHLRRLARIFGVDDHLDVGEVGNGIERHARDRIDAGEGHENGRKSDQEDVARRPADESRNHFGASGCVKACSAAFRLLSASIRKVAAVTTSSPCADAVEHFDVAVAAAAELDRARLEAAFALGDQHDLARPAVDHGAGGDGDRGLLVCARLEHDVGVHVHFEAPIGIGDFDADASRPRLGPQLRIDERHFAFDRLCHVGADRDGGARADLDRGQVALGDVGDDPQVGMVGNPIELLAGLHALTVDDLLLDHVAGRRRRPIERPRIGAGLRALRGCGSPERRDCAAAARRPRDFDWRRTPARPLPRGDVPIATRRSICAR